MFASCSSERIATLNVAEATNVVTAYCLQKYGDGNYIHCIIQGGPIKVSHYQLKKIVLKISNEIIDFFVKLKYESSSIIQSVGNKYSVRDLLL